MTLSHVIGPGTSYVVVQVCVVSRTSKEHIKNSSDNTGNEVADYVTDFVDVCTMYLFVDSLRYSVVFCYLALEQNRLLDII